MIDPEYWSDEEIGRWSAHARLMYIGLWNIADDEGRFKAADELLNAQLFPYDRKVSIKKLKAELGNKVQWYEANGLKYGFIRNFSKHQKIDHPSESKLPIPPKFDEPSMNPPRIVPPNIIEDNIIEDNISGRVVFPPSFDNEVFKKAWGNWKEFRVQIRKKIVPASEPEALVALHRLSDGNSLLAIQIISQSIANGWQGLFAIRDNNGRSGESEIDKLIRDAKERESKL